MFCPSCGTANDNNNFRCTKCAAIIQVLPASAVPSDLGDSTVARMLLPVGRSGLAIAAVGRRPSLTSFLSNRTILALAAGLVLFAVFRNL